MWTVLVTLSACVGSKGSPGETGVDEDEDGYIVGEDCDDSDPAVHATDAWIGTATAADVAGFCDGYCTRMIAGALDVEDSDLRDLDDLSCLTSAGEVTFLHNPELVDLSGLGRLSAICSSLPGAVVLDMPIEDCTGGVGALFISDNDALTEIAGLDALAVATQLRVTGNDALTAIRGFDQLDLASGWGQALLVISDNASLREVSGLSALTALGYLEIDGNPTLETLPPFEALARIGYMEISGDSALTSVRGFDALSDATSLEISDNARLVEVSGFASLTDLDGDLTIASNPSLDTISGFDALSRPDASIVLADDDALVDVDFLQHLEAVWALELAHDDALVDLGGLGALSSIEGSLTLYDDDTLIDLTPLYGLEAVGGAVTIRENDALPDGAAQALVDHIESVGGDVDIQ